MADGTSRTIRFGSVCSGIEAASVAWEPLGWKAAWLSEIEPFPCAVLAHHYPDTPNHGDMTTLVRRILKGEVEAPDVFTGGTPCQAFSVAGKRQSLDDARGNLSLTFVEIADAIDHIRAARGDDECVVVWENVPGVLSTRDNAFGCFLGALAGAGCELQPAGGKWTDAGCVYGPARAVAWRVLDAQYFGLAQRRRRVFVVASARNGFDPAAVLFELESLRRDSAPRREAREAAPTIPSRSSGGGGLGTDFDCDGGLIPSVSMCLNAGAMGRIDGESETFIPVAHSLRGEGFDASEDGTGRGTPLVPISFHWNAQPDQQTFLEDQAGTLTRSQEAAVFAIQAGAKQQTYAMQSMAVRRLTPREAERLQGFNDDYTRIPWRGKPADQCPDGPRYRSLGNSWAVPVVRWIGDRINQQIEWRKAA